MTHDPNTIEVLLETLDLKGRKLISDFSDDVLVSFLTITTTEISDSDAMFKMVPQTKIVYSRLSALGYQINNNAILLVSLFCDTPGEMVMYSVILAKYAKDRKLQTITCQDVVQRFSEGFLSKEQLENFWEQQKCDVFYGDSNKGRSNLLDSADAVISLICLR